MTDTVNVPRETFQDRVLPWLFECFGSEIAGNIEERCDRFIEEAFEQVQALNWPRERALALVDYVYGRPPGDPHQEAGGVMVTFAALCQAAGLEMEKAGNDELARIMQPEILQKIRAKQAAKPTGSALPVAAPKAEPASDKFDVLPLGTPVEVDFKEAEVGRQTLYVAGVVYGKPGMLAPEYWLSETWPVKCPGDVSTDWNRNMFSSQPLSNPQQLESYWFDPRDPEVTDTNPDNILSSYYAKFDVVMIQCGDMAMFGFWYEPADGSDFQYRYFSDRDQADAEAMAVEAALRAQPEAPKVEQEPVAWLVGGGASPIMARNAKWVTWMRDVHGASVTPLYTHPAPASDERSSDREVIKAALYENLCAADNQDIPLEDYPDRIFEVLDRYHPSSDELLEAFDPLVGCLTIFPSDLDEGDDEEVTIDITRRELKRIFSVVGLDPHTGAAIAKHKGPQS